MHILILLGMEIILTFLVSKNNFSLAKKSTNLVLVAAGPLVVALTADVVVVGNHEVGKVVAAGRRPVGGAAAVAVAGRRRVGGGGLGPEVGGAGV